ncbi:PDE2A isoform 17 [Pan troglodytes]|uniref:Phosphodiesterase 2A n=2 Tax=Homininae TaxID=207598 RepID=F5H2R8_HUMAN|nr:phosphodiesterase 2A [Homo sapiens]PNI89504.1 PDE2A isoform 14 [Pan troglodytes]KAI2561681.1 phosphodiesterase 2A [Homo sapiens]KAI2561682.1 phosphodiesterase 2A [Homo sapiens]KAI4072989.1 phosphodiesterase 2A [Homo sapiens]
MVLVLHHILIAVVQFLRRGQQVFLKPDEPPPPPQPCADSLQPAWTPLQRSQDPQGVETTDWRTPC